jgi:hypothetical protein
VLTGTPWNKTTSGTPSASAGALDVQQRLEPARLGDSRVTDVPLDLHGLGRLPRLGARCQRRRRGTATTAEVDLRSGRRGVDGTSFVR